ncbi:aldo/keto reductase [Mycobacteroides abscessus subsp. abscessus]|nr:aldo/keto reductase [Mycobacteroides abscessus subsp. abscessus]
MKYTKLGNSDLMVSRICLGCMGFGDSKAGQHSWVIDEEQTREIIKYSLDKGINFFDTAIAYQNGTSEQYVGRAKYFWKRTCFKFFGPEFEKSWYGLCRFVHLSYVGL